MQTRFDINDYYIREHICANCGCICSYITHKEFRYCPHCGTKTKGCYTMIPEDHWGIPIPSEKNCEGVLKDDDEAFERSVYLKDMMGERR